MCLPSTSNVHSTSTTPEPTLPPHQSSSTSDSSSSTTAQLATSHQHLTTDDGDTTKDKTNNSVAISSSSNLKKPSITATYSSPYDVITIELNRKAGKGLGLSLTRRQDPGSSGSGNPSEIFISRVIRGGVADSASPDPLAHQILHGDQIIEVNGRNLSQMSFEDAAVLLKVSS